MPRHALFAVVLLLQCLAVRASAAMQLRNLTISPEFICPGQAVTLTFEENYTTNNGNWTWGVLSTNNAVWDDPNDYAFMTTTFPSGSTAASTPGTPSGLETNAVGANHPDGFWHTYTWVTIVPASMAGTNITFLIKGHDGAQDWAFSSTWDAQISLTTELTCHKKAVYNNATLWEQSSSARLVIQDNCGTPSNTPTRTPTPTQTLTRTPTATPSATPSYSSTVTATATFTPTATPPATSTYTVTLTATVTFTPTATRSASPTATPTATQTFSATYTYSPGPTLTFSETSTATPSPTPTATPSQTPSVTFTLTASPTSTYTVTRTDSPTPTPTVTITTPFTSTSTPTISPSATQSDTFTPSQTYSDTPTWTPTATQTVTYTPTNSFTASPSTTPTITPSATPTASPTPSPTLTPSPSFSASPSFTVSPTVSQTPIPSPYKVVVTLYNAAGERVKVVFDGTSSILPLDAKLNRDVIRSGLDTMTIDLGGVLSSGGTLLTWNGQNDSGQPLSGGTYYLKVETTDPFGAKTSLIKGVQVLQGKAGNHLDVFNSAGELVYRADFTGLTRTVSDFSLNKTVLAESYLPNGTAEDAIVATFKLDDGSSFTSGWSGLGMNGRPVEPGSYNVVLVTDTQSGSQVRSIGVTIIKNVDAGLSADPIVCPNPATAAGNAFGKKLLIKYPAGELWDVHANVYNQAGERVGGATDPASLGKLWFDYESRASGVYVVVLQGRLNSSGSPYRRVLKAAIVR